MAEYDNLKRELQLIEREKIEGLIVRSRVQWHEDGEKSTRYFMNLEKSNSVKKHMRKLKIHDGTVITDPTEILEKQKEFYCNLLSS